MGMEVKTGSSGTGAPLILGIGVNIRNPVRSVLSPVTISALRSGEDLWLNTWVSDTGSLRGVVSGGLWPQGTACSGVEFSVGGDIRLVITI